MGTLSGGGKEVISVGKRSLLGANSGLGISLGDDCIVESWALSHFGFKSLTPRWQNSKGQGVVSVPMDFSFDGIQVTERSRLCLRAVIGADSTHSFTPTINNAY